MSFFSNVTGVTGSFLTGVIIATSLLMVTCLCVLVCLLAVLSCKIRSCMTQIRLEIDSSRQCGKALYKNLAALSATQPRIKTSEQQESRELVNEVQCSKECRGEVVVGEGTGRDLAVQFSNTLELASRE